MNTGSIKYFLIFACLISFASATLPHIDAQINNKATIWFEKEYDNYFRANANDSIPPAIYGVSVSPSSLKVGDPRSEINAFVYDKGDIGIVYADICNRMNLMLDLDHDNRYTGYCGSNLPPGIYNVTIFAIDKAGNAAIEKSSSITIRDPNDLNGNGIEDSLEKQSSKELKVIVLHDGNLSGVAADKLGILPGSSLTIPRDKLEELSKMKGVKGIYEDTELKILDSPSMSHSIPKRVNDPRKEWKLKGNGSVVALIDTGADPNHESLEGKILVFQDFVNGQADPYDDNGHGTRCASLIAGDDSIGVAPEAKLAILKVMDKDGKCHLSDARKALDWCLKNKEQYGIKIISFSVGAGKPTDKNPILEEDCNQMVKKGLLMCVAAGNNGPDAGSIVMPGDAEKVITVGAVDENGEILEESSRGPTISGEIKPDLVTLGVNVVSALAQTKSDTSSMSGTSMAVPQVSGASAIILQAKPAYEPLDVKRLLLKTADDLGEPGADYVYGYGALNLTKALESIDVELESLETPHLKNVVTNKDEASVGEPVMIEAEASGDIKAINSNVIGPDRELEIPMDDFDGNGIYSARWETSFWTPGEYKVAVNLLGKFGEEDSKVVPFHLMEMT